MGRLISGSKIKTYVPKGRICLSGCAIVWMDGVERWIGAYATVGFHRPRRMENGQTVDGTTPSLIEYFKMHGASDKALPYLLTHWDGFYYLTPKNTAELGIEANFTEQ